MSVSGSSLPTTMLPTTPAPQFSASPSPVQPQGFPAASSDQYKSQGAQFGAKKPQPKFGFCLGGLEFCCGIPLLAGCGIPVAGGVLWGAYKLIKKAFSGIANLFKNKTDDNKPQSQR